MVLALALTNELKHGLETVAVPAAVWGAVLATWQAIARLRSLRRLTTERVDLLRTRIAGKRDGDLSRSLVLDRPLPVSLRGAGLDGAPDPIAELYGLLERSRALRIVGAAGAGKSTLALSLVAHAADRQLQERNAPLLEVVSLRDWKPQRVRRALTRPLLGRRGRRYEELVEWMATALNVEHPVFSPRHLAKLISDQRLIICLDGLDEVRAEHRATLEAALVSHARAGIPLLVLGRPGGNSETHALDAPLPGFDTVEMQPLRPEVVRKAIARNPGWRTLMHDARRPRVVGAMLRSPLLLSIALLTWRPDERPRALEESDHPQEALWNAYIERATSHRTTSVAAAREAERAAEWIALATRRRTSVDFRPSDACWHRIGAQATAFGCGALLMFYGWTHLCVSYMLVAWLAICCGLLVPDRMMVTRFGRRIPFGTASGYAALVAVLAILTFLLFIGVNMVKSFAETPVATPDGSEPLWRHLDLLGAWWHNFGADRLRWSLQPLIMITALLPASIATYDLTSPHRDVVTGLVPRALKQTYSLRLLGIPLIVVGFALDKWSCAILGVAFLAPLLCIGFSAFALRRDGEIAGAEAHCRALVEMGLLHRIGSRYRFRHDELSSTLARRALQRLGRADHLGALPSPFVALDVVDDRMLPTVRAWTGPVLRQLSEAWPWSSSVAWHRCIYVYLAEGRSDAAEAILRPAYEASRSSGLRSQLAELVDTQGRLEEADRLWPNVRTDTAGGFVMLNKLVRSRLRRGDVPAALAMLERAVAQAKRDNAVWAEVLLCELRCRFGDVRAQNDGFTGLERLAARTAGELRERAVLELARVHVEVRGDRLRARALLDAQAAGGAPTALLCARYALLEAADDDARGAAAWIGEAFDSWCWDCDPTHTLELLAIVMLLQEAPAPIVSAQLDSMLRQGWRLWGRAANPFAYALDVESRSAADRLLRRVVAAPAPAPALAAAVRS